MMSEVSPDGPDPLVAARRRGWRLAIAVFNHRDTLRPTDAASYSGRTATSIEAARQRGALYALTLRGQPHEFRYPRWQFDACPERLATVLDPFVRARSNCYVVHQFLLTPHRALGGATPASIIIGTGHELDIVLQLIRQILDAEQGAG
ncbi:integrase [Paraburkholderia phymatum]|uniref:Integrase n=1 Tax=Paraburkholderia phymatum TaxID=148447 RepID=A0ACC6TXY0_9BURK